MKCVSFLSAVLCTAIAFEVRIQSQGPVLTLTLSAIGLDVKDIKDVVLNYVIKHVAFQGVGLRTWDGWMYRTRDAWVDEAEDITAYAEVYDINGHMRLRTQRSNLKLVDDKSVPGSCLPPKMIRGAVVFREDFNSLNMGNWHHEVSMFGGFNGEFQVYTNDAQNTFTKNGNLYIKPTLTVNDPRFDENFLHHGKMDMHALFGECTEDDNNGCIREGKDGLLPPVMSGKLKSKAGLRYGTVEIRARIPRGDWLWPAIWMMPKYSSYGPWPRSGEIDIMEARGNEGSIGVGQIISTIHWGPDAGQNRFLTTSESKYTGSWADYFHTWKLEWTPDHIITSVDGQQIMYVDPGSSFWNKGGFGGSNLWSDGQKMAPFDQEFYMILNVAVGGTGGFFPDDYDYSGVKKPWSNCSLDATKDFWSARNQWEKTWLGDRSALVIDYIEMRSWY